MPDLIAELHAAAESLGTSPAAEWFRWLAEQLEEENAQ